jgi:hypothetical protein
MSVSLHFSFLIQTARYNEIKKRANAASVIMAVLGTLGSVFVVVVNEYCFDHEYLQYTPLQVCSFGKLATVSIICLVLLDLTILYYYYLRTLITKLAFEFSSTWVAFWRTGIWKQLLTELAVCNLQPYHIIRTPRSNIFIINGVFIVFRCFLMKSHFYHHILF